MINICIRLLKNASNNLSLYKEWLNKHDSIHVFLNCTKGLLGRNYQIFKAIWYKQTNQIRQSSCIMANTVVQYSYVNSRQLPYDSVPLWLMSVLLRILNHRNSLHELFRLNTHPGSYAGFADSPCAFFRYSFIGLLFYFGSFILGL